MIFQKGSNGLRFLFHNSIIDNIMAYQDRIETNFSTLSFYFEVNIVV